MPSGARTVDSHVRAIRRKLGADVVRTVHGVGYAVETVLSAPRRVKRPPERPLDPLPTLKLKLSVVILAAVAVTVVVFWAGVRLGMWPSAHRVLAGCIALVVVCSSSRGMTSPLREMVTASEAMARGEFSQRITATSHDEVGDARARVQPDGGRAGRDRSRAPRPGRQRVARAAHADHRAAGAAREHRRRRGRPRPRDAPHDAGAGRAARPPRVSNCSICRGSSRARFPLDRRVVRDQADARQVALRSPGCMRRCRSRSRPEPRPFPPKATPSACTRSCRTSSRTPSGTRRRKGWSAGRRASRTEPRSKSIDQGPGIPAVRRERVFERFYRADAARSSRDGGAGLGLAIARWIVDLHGGDIRRTVGKSSRLSPWSCASRAASSCTSLRRRCDCRGRRRGRLPVSPHPSAKEVDGVLDPHR